MLLGLDNWVGLKGVDRGQFGAFPTVVSMSEGENVEESMR